MCRFEGYGTLCYSVEDHVLTHNSAGSAQKHLNPNFSENSENFQTFDVYTIFIAPVALKLWLLKVKEKTSSYHRISQQRPAGGGSALRPKCLKIMIFRRKYIF